MALLPGLGRERDTPWRREEPAGFRGWRRMVMGAGVMVFVVAMAGIWLGEDLPRGRGRSSWALAIGVAAWAIGWGRATREYQTHGGWRVAGSMKLLAVLAGLFGVAVVGWPWLLSGGGWLEGVPLTRVPLMASCCCVAVAAWKLAGEAELREGSDIGLRCPGCGYDLRATPAAEGPRIARCPECGWEVTAEG